MSMYYMKNHNAVNWSPEAWTVFGHKIPRTLILGRKSAAPFQSLSRKNLSHTFTLRRHRWSYCV